MSKTTHELERAWGQERRGLLDRINELVERACKEEARVKELEAEVERLNKLVTMGNGIMVEKAYLTVLEARLEAVREPVRWFAEQMERKLAAHDDREGWGECIVGWLMNRMTEEAEELRHAWIDARCADRDRTDPEWDNVIDEAADVANFAMMIADNARAILNAPTPGEEE